MISFSLTNEQKRSSLNSMIQSLEMQIYNLILLTGGDPDNYDFSQIDEMSESPAPSTENQLYTAYRRYLSIQEKIANL